MVTDDTTIINKDSLSMTTSFPIYNVISNNSRWRNLHMFPYIFKPTSTFSVPVDHINDIINSSSLMPLNIGRTQHSLCSFSRNRIGSMGNPVFGKCFWYA
jgi:hypothetical protein